MVVVDPSWFHHFRSIPSLWGHWYAWLWQFPGNSFRKPIGIEQREGWAIGHCLCSARCPRCHMGEWYLTWKHVNCLTDLIVGKCVAKLCVARDSCRCSSCSTHVASLSGVQKASVVGYEPKMQLCLGVRGSAKWWNWMNEHRRTLTIHKAFHGIPWSQAISCESGKSWQIPKSRGKTNKKQQKMQWFLPCNK